MSIRKEREQLLRSIGVVNSSESFANCVVCHNRKIENLVEVWLPVSKTTMCKGCAKELADKITSHLSHN